MYIANTKLNINEVNKRHNYTVLTNYTRKSIVSLVIRGKYSMVNCVLIGMINFHRLVQHVMLYGVRLGMKIG